MFSYILFFKTLIVLQVSSKILSSILFLECLLEPAGKFWTTDSISLMIGIFKYSVYSLINVGSLCFSRNVTILSKFSNLVV